MSRHFVFSKVAEVKKPGDAPILNRLFRSASLTAAPDGSVERTIRKYKRKYSIKSVYVPKDMLADLKVFYRQVAGDERNNAVLKRLAP